MNNMGTLYALTYNRVSTEEQARHGYSLDGQVEVCGKTAVTQGYSVYENFIERGKSAKTLNRPELQRMLALIESGKVRISAVIIYAVNRLARDAHDFLTISLLLRKHKIKLISVTECIDETPSGKFVATMLSGLAQLDNDQKGERVSSSMRAAVKQGRWLHAPKGYSFKEDAIGKKILHPNEESRHIQKAFEMIGTGLYKQRDVLRELKKDGCVIYPQTLNKMLRNPVYCGLLEDRHNLNDGNYIEGKHEPIINREEFFKVQDILAGRRVRIVPKERNNPHFPLRGYVVCPTCNKKMTASFSKGKKIKVPYYHCSAKGCPRFQKKVLEPKYLEYLKSLAMSDEHIKMFEEMVIAMFKEKTKVVEAQRKGIVQKIESLKEEKRRFVHLWSRTGPENEEDIKAEIASVNQRIYEQESLLADTKENPNIDECWEYVKYFINSVADLWETGDLNSKQIIQGLITPSGFKFSNNLIEPLEIPYFLTVLKPQTAICQNWGG